MNATTRDESGRAKGLAERKQDLDKRRAKVVVNMASLNRQIAEFRQQLRTLKLRDEAQAEELSAVSAREVERSATLRDIAAKGAVVTRALRERDARLDLAEKRKTLAALGERIDATEAKRRNIDTGVSTCSAIERVLTRTIHEDVDDAVDLAE